MTEDAILREFVKFNKSMSHGLTVQKDNEHKQKLDVVFKLFGTELSTRKRFTSDRTNEEDGEDR